MSPNKQSSRENPRFCLPGVWCYYIPVYLKIDDPATYRDILCGQSYINAAVVRDAGNGQIKEAVDIIAKETQKDQAVAAVATGAVVVLAIGAYISCYPKA